MGLLGFLFGGQEDHWQYWSFGKSQGEVSDPNQGPSGQYREFVYIDEDSVRDLSASTDEGGIPTEQIRRRANTDKKGGSAGVSAGAGPAKGSVSYRSSTGSRNEREERFSFNSIESIFTQLYTNDATKPRIQVNDKKGHTFGTDELSIGKLKRGQLIEVHVKIEPHKLFKLIKIIEFVDDASPEDIDEESEEIGLIKESLGDKVPVTMTANGIGVTDGGELDLQGSNTNRDNNLKLVGLLDENNLFIDPNQSFSADKEFIAFCRVESTDFQWYPLKLVRMINTISKSVAGKFNKQFERVLDTVFSEFQSEVTDQDIGSDGWSNNQLQDVQERYIRHLSRFIPIGAPTESEVDKIVRDSEIHQPIGVGNASEARKELLKSIHDDVLEWLDISNQYLIESPTEIRSEFDWNSMSSGGEDSVKDDNYHLEVSVVAIYW